MQTTEGRDQIIEKIIANILFKKDIENVSHQVLVKMTQIFKRYLHSLAVELKEVSALSNRTCPTWKDLMFIDMKELQEFATENYAEYPILEYESHVIPKHKRKKTTIRIKKNNVPSCLPEFPPEHSYMQTKVFKFKQDSFTSG
jgi:hypothetical protein